MKDLLLKSSIVSMNKAFYSNRSSSNSIGLARIDFFFAAAAAVKKSVYNLLNEWPKANGFVVDEEQVHSLL